MIENVCDITVNVDEKLSIDKFNVDEENAHIVLKENPSDEEFRKLVLCCPAALYKVEDDGSKRFDYAVASNVAPAVMHLRRDHP